LHNSHAVVTYAARIIATGQPHYQTHAMGFSGSIRPGIPIAGEMPGRRQRYATSCIRKLQEYD
jgi:hypothetical protein